MQAFTLFEEGVSDQRSRVTSLQSILSALHACHVFGAEHRDTLTLNAAGYAARLLRKSDQVKALCTAARLSWQVGGSSVQSGAEGRGAWPSGFEWGADRSEVQCASAQCCTLIILHV
jgi:vacuolar protein sorting-associated protein 35